MKFALPRRLMRKPAKAAAQRPPHALAPERLLTITSIFTGRILEQTCSKSVEDLGRTDGIAGAALWERGLPNASQVSSSSEDISRFALIAGGSSTQPIKHIGWDPHARDPNEEIVSELEQPFGYTAQPP